MKIQKKLAMLLSIALLLTLLPASFAGAVDGRGELSVSPKTQTVTQGTQVIVDVMMDKNPGIVSLKFNLTWDEEQLTLARYTAGLKLQGVDEWGNPIDGASTHNSSMKGKFVYFLQNNTSVEDSIDKGKVGSFTFNVADDAIGKVDIKIEMDDGSTFAYAANGTPPVPFDPTNGTVTITKDVTALAATLEDPTIGGTPQTEITDTNADFAGTVVWKQGGTPLAAGEVFESGKAYTADVTLTPTDYRVFKDITAAKVTLNNEAVSGFTTANEGQSVTFTKSFTAPKQELTITGATATTRAYDPGNLTVAITGATLSGGTGVEIDTITGTIANANVGDNKPVTVAVTLKGANKDNYTVKTLTGVTANITKATYTPTAKEKSVRYSATGAQTVALPELNSVTYSNVQVTADSGSILNGTPTVSSDGNSLSFAIKGLGVGDAGKTATITLKGSGNNYSDFTQTVTVKIIDKTPVTPGLSNAAITGTYGTAITLPTVTTTGITASGTANKPVKYYSDAARTQEIASFTTTPNVGTYYVRGFYDDDDQIGTADGTITISAKSVTVTPDANQSKVYGAAEPTTFTFTNGSLAATEFTGALARAAGSDVGEYAYTLGTLSAGDNYTLSLGGTAKFAITPAPLTIKSATIAPKTYDGTTAATVTEVEFDGLVGDETLTLNTDYTVSGANFDSADVATATTVTATVTLAGNVKNYTLASGALSQTAKIAKATYTGAIPAYTINLAHDAEARVLQLATVLPMPSGWTYIDSGEPITIVTVSTDDDEKEVTLVNPNYENVTTTITVKVAAEDVEVIDINDTFNGNKVYDGVAVKYEGIYDAAWSTDDGEAPKNAGSYTLTLSHEDDDAVPATEDNKETEDDESADAIPAKIYNDQIISVTISPKPITVQAKDVTITVGDTYTVEFVTAPASLLASGDTWTTLPVAVKPAQTAIGEYANAITITEGVLPIPGNYTVTYTSGKLTIDEADVVAPPPVVSPPASGGGGGSRGGGGSSSSGDSKPAEIEPSRPPVEPNPSAAPVKQPVKQTTPVTAAIVAEIATQYADIAPDAWYAETVAFAVTNGLFQGTGDGQFEPNGTMTRAMIVTVLARTAGVDTSGGAEWYGKAVEWGKQNGITDGANLNDAVSREQIVTMLWRFAGQPSASGSASQFSDASQIDDWAKDAFVWAAANGIVQGNGDGTAAPLKTATRAEVATFIMRFVTLMSK